MPVRSFHDQHHGHVEEHPSFPLKRPPVPNAVVHPTPVPAVSEPEPPADEPATPAPTSDGKPPLPRRKKRQNLAPQLMQSDDVSHAEPMTGERSAERTRDGLAAFQRGTRDARLTDDWRSEGAPSS
jgi:hypothetical protein